MKKDSKIVVTGAAGFIGSCMVGYLNQQGYENLVMVDLFGRADRSANLEGKKAAEIVARDLFEEWLTLHHGEVAFIIHLGARTDTTEFDYSIHQRLNFDYSCMIWNLAARHHIPLLYASSAATYGSGEYGYSDGHELPEKLQPLNPYGVSKNEFDKWVLQQELVPPFWAGLKFFNVYGPNEYHKARMASVIFHAFQQMKKNGFVNLFRSHKPAYKDGEQLRDFIYVKDLVAVCYWLMQHRPASAIYNLGTGKARSFYDLAAATFNGAGQPVDIRFIDMPEDIREKYQYFTEADMNKLKNAGYTQPFHSLEEGINDYVKNYLLTGRYY